jgi:hypothetical protein
LLTSLKTGKDIGVMLLYSFMRLTPFFLLKIKIYKYGSE